MKEHSILRHFGKLLRFTFKLINNQALIINQTNGAQVHIEGSIDSGETGETGETREQEKQEK